jgi:hypothetical protein
MDEEDRVIFFAIGLCATLLVLAIALALIFPNATPGKIPPGGEQFPIQNPAS